MITNRQKIINIEARIKSAIYNMKYNSFQRNFSIIFLLISIVGLILIYDEFILVVLFYVVVCLAFLICFITQVFESYIYDGYLRSKKMCNENGEYPILIFSRQINRNQTELLFRNIGIPSHKWQEAKIGLSSSFHKEIVSIKSSNNNKHIHMILYNGFYDYGETIYWSDDYMIDGPNIVLGDKMGEKCFISLKDEPHILLGGRTGSGKSYALILQLYQCIKKGYQVYLADFKLGLDYNPYIQSHSKMLFNKAAVLSSFRTVRDEMLQRFTILANTPYNNIDDYNKHSEDKIQHIIFACDELASLTDLKSLDKDEKQMTYEIIRLLEEIAEKGRAVGVNLFLSLQRPDADVLPGRIKNNLGYRMAGKSDGTLSGIIIGTTEASKEIENFDVGVFYDNYGVKFKVYMLRDEDFKD